MPGNERSEVAIDVGPGTEPAPPRPRVDAPFCLLVIGDLGGAAGRTALASRQPIAFDRDDVDATIARIRPVIELASPAAEPTRLGFRSVDDFHPERLFVDVPVFASLRRLRVRLADPRTFDAAARELAGGEAAASAGAQAPPSASDLAASPDSQDPPPAANLLDRMLAETEPPPSGRSTVQGAAAGHAASGSAGRAANASSTDDLTAFIREIVRPHLVASPDPRQAEMVAAVDDAITTQMRALLRLPAFRALESAWRSIERLARRCETGTTLRAFLLDVGDAELDEALDDASGALATELQRVLVESAAHLPDGGRWSALVVLRAFGDSEADDARLGALAAIGRSLGAPILADARPALAGLDRWAGIPDPHEWKPRESPSLEALRGSSDAAWLCLAAPRVLLRAPYGEDGEPVDAFHFEETADSPDAGAFVWGSAAATCGLLLAQNFTLRGWSMRPGEVSELGGLPLHLQRQDGETTVLPCAETVMTERAAERLMALGITPIATLRDSDAVRVVRFQSFASPPTALPGPWSAA
jgi:type VI secretion system ImpC/EvpB family protein